MRGCRARRWWGGGCFDGGVEFGDGGIEWYDVLKCVGWLHERVGGYLDDDG